jgi:lysophospholipase L1-like esterase
VVEDGGNGFGASEGLVIAMSTRTLGIILATLAAVAALLGVVRLVQPDETLGWFDATACQLQVDDADQAPKRVEFGKVSAVLIGDSWATGEGIYPRELAVRLEVNLHVAAVGGTGYVNPGACGGREFISRVWEIPQDARMVVLAGGVNDVGVPEDALAAGVRATIAATRSRAPGARIVVVGVPRVLLLEDESTGAVDDVLADAGADLFVDVRGWDISLLPDRIHPDPAGAEEYGRLLGEAIGPVT